MHSSLSSQPSLLWKKVWRAYLDEQFHYFWDHQTPIIRKFKIITKDSYIYSSMIRKGLYVSKSENKDVEEEKKEREGGGTLI